MVVDLKEYSQYIEKNKTLYKKNKFEELIKEIDKILFKYQNNRLNSLLLKDKGNCYSRLGDYAKAIDSYEESLRFNNNIQEEKDIKESLATSYYFNGQYDIALKKLLESFENGTNFPLVVTLILEIYIMKNEPEEGYKFFINNKDKINVFLQNPDLLIQYGVLLQYKEKYTDAIEKFKKAYKLGYDNYFYYESIGDCYYQLKEYTNSLKYYKKLLKKETDYLEAIDKIIYIYDILKDEKNKNRYTKLKNVSQK